ncbi:hypothetical protein [Candidatus Neptunochlamydia vexilliferae]|uniref:Uncharacterized protein n=1 Tax=Candidatus Neptunichlamydia vexilliferae TaxID=1651774 RepID=A0ABS0AXP4_9BACT|nr:hypothetical protein [Candidatus Neptunochlamydia vexilliferae]MBF5058906.1 hypothetical protein [Candidatus Neptunochlamydia vexilliferae]
MEPEDEAAKTKLQVLFFQLGELLKDPPDIMNLSDWRDNVEYALTEIHEISDSAYERLHMLAHEAINRAIIHVNHIDKDMPPDQLERSSAEYFEQVGFITSEINALKSM